MAGTKKELYQGNKNNDNVFHYLESLPSEGIRPWRKLAIIPSLDDRYLPPPIIPPLADGLQCLDVQENVRITIGDQDVRQFLLQEYDIAEPLRIQAFDKELRRKIVLACLEQGAGFRQLSRLTGVPYGVIHRIFDRK